MSDYSAGELARLALCLPELRDAESRFRAAALAAHITYVIPEDGAYRSAILQAALVKMRDAAVALGEPSYPVAPPGHSFHEAGAAFDVHLTNPEAEDDSDPRYAQLADIADEVGLRPGYNFTKPDIFHFELPVDLDTAKAEFASLTTKRTIVGGSAAAIAVLLFLAAGSAS